MPAQKSAFSREHTVSKFVAAPLASAANASAWSVAGAWRWLLPDQLATARLARTRSRLAVSRSRLTVLAAVHHPILFAVIESFDDMGLKEDLLRGIYSYGFEKPSAIQQRAIKPLIMMRDTIAQAQSGTGKTATFTIGLLQNIDLSNRDCQALILAPTRELASQIVKVVMAIGDYLGVSTMVRATPRTPGRPALPPRSQWVVPSGQWDSGTVGQWGSGAVGQWGSGQWAVEQWAVGQCRRAPAAALRLGRPWLPAGTLAWPLACAAA